MIIETQILAKTNGGKGRTVWCLPEGGVVTVEEFVRHHYLREASFRDCLVDSSCVYGGLLWVLFHDLLFHDNLSSRHPLCAQFYNAPQAFYESNRTVIENRLEAYRKDREAVLETSFAKYAAHPFFQDPRSRMAKYHGSWSLKNFAALKQFACGSVEHDQEGLIRESLVQSDRGRNPGWPDLVAWNESSIVFSEVKAMNDQLSDEQLRWISRHADRYTVEVVRVRAQE